MSPGEASSAPIYLQMWLSNKNMTRLFIFIEWTAKNKPYKSDYGNNCALDVFATWSRRETAGVRAGGVLWSGFLKPIPRWEAARGAREKVLPKTRSRPREQRPTGLAPSVACGASWRSWNG